MANGRIKELRKELNVELKERNKKIAQDIVLAEATYDELGKKYGVSKETIRYVGRKFALKAPLRKGTIKHDNWCKRISDSKRSDNKPKK